MKRNMLTLVVLVLSILIFTTLSWGQCPEDEDDRGECDTLVVTCLDCEIDTTVPGPYFVRFPILVTHDQIGYLDSISAFVIPLAWTRTNPSAYCSVSAFWNNTHKLPLPPNFYEHSIFRHQEISPGDTMFNRMMTLAEQWLGLEWDNIILNLDGISHFWLTAVCGGADQLWWESDRELLATMTFKVEDTMHVCIDTVFWPPNSRLTFTRSDAATYVPRDNLPQCFWIGPAGEPDFTIAATPDTQYVQAGQATIYSVTLTSQFGFDSPCTLTVTGLPDFASADFDPNPLVPTGSSPMNVTTLATTPPGTYDLTITATELVKTQLVHDTTVVLVVLPPPDFTIEVEPDSQEVQAGKSVGYEVILTSLNGFDIPCTLTVTGLPNDVSADFIPNPATPTDTSLMFISTAETTSPGTYSLTITATELTKAQIVHDTTVVLVVTLAPDFTIEAEPDTQEVWLGNSVDYDIILTSIGGYSNLCCFSTDGLPANALATFNPTCVNPTDTSVMTITTTELTTPGDYTITVIAYEDKGSKLEHATDVVLLIREPDFNITASPETLEVTQDAQGAFEVVVTSLYGFNSSCSLYVYDLPDYSSGVFNPGQIVPTDTSELTISVADTTPVGTYTLTIVAALFPPPSKTREADSVEVVLVVNPPGDFAIDVQPDSLRIPRGADSNYIVTLTSISGFSSTCTLWVDGLPGGTEGNFDPPTLVPTGSTDLNISVDDTVTEDYYTLTVTAREVVDGKVIEHSEEVTLIVTFGNWDFYLEAYPDTQVVVVEDSITYEVTMVPNIGFSASCTLSIESGLPTDATSRFDPEVIAPNDTSILTIIAAATTPPGFYDIVIKGTANLKQESTTTVVLRVDEQSDVEDWADNANTPKSFALFQNQPNPFNPETEISYYLPKACQVRLTIYNVLGQRVKTLLDGYQDTGIHTLLWDGRSDDGAQLSSGIYFYRLQADSFFETKKMTLMK